MPGIFGSIGGAVSDIFGGIGELKAADAYGKAAEFSRQNAELSKQSTAIQKTQAERQIYQTIGGMKADIAGAGLAASGSALDLIRSSASQGALTQQLIRTQGLINVTGYEQEATAYQGQADAAKMAGAGQIAGGVIGGIGAIFGL